MGVKIAVIGGASSYTPELFAELADHPEWSTIDQVALMDPNQEKLRFIQGVCGRLIEKKALRTKPLATQDLEEAISDSDFVILTARIGGLAARIRDEKLPMQFGMVGNETTGPGGFACALRTLPAMMEVAREVERIAPKAWILVLSNPAGIVTECLINHAHARTLGFCNIPINTTYGLAEILDVAPERIRLDIFGLNHLTWVRAAFVDGAEMLGPLIAKATSRRSSLYRRGLVGTLIEPQWLQALGMIPGWYLRYFYCPPEVLAQDMRSETCRGEQDVEAEQRLHKVYQTQGYGVEARRILTAKGGSQYYLPVFQAIDSIIRDRGDVVVVDTRNDGTIPDLPPNACVEVPCRIYADRVEPLPVGAMPLSVRGLTQAVKAYEQLTVEAALSGSRVAALQALMTHPLVPSFSQASGFLDQVMKNERAFLPAFFPPAGGHAARRASPGRGGKGARGSA